MTTPRSELASITAPLVAAGTSIGDTADCIAQLEAFLDRHTPFRRAETITAGESTLPCGWAVSPTQAAMCARDYRRTHAFARGLALAIDDARQRHAERPVRVLYAGCGPWALIALPSMAALPRGAATFTLLDAHAGSVDSVEALVRNAGLGDTVDGVALADAAAWTIPPARLPDVIVTETMNVVLAREPQVAITRHLVKQAPNAVLVPQSVRVDALLVDPERERSRFSADGQTEMPVPDRVELGTVFEVSRETAAGWPNAGEALPAARIQIPADADPRYAPRLFTRIETFGGERLDAYESWLTQPHPFPDSVVPRLGSTIAFRYALEPTPGLVAVEAWPDRLQLPVAFDPAKLEAALDAVDGTPWTDHFVTRNYEGRWSAIALRAPAGTETQHPVLQITSHPGVTDFTDTPVLDRAPYLRHVLTALGFPLCAARLMRLDPGSAIHTHRDADLDIDAGCARLHIPITTNPGVEFLLNDVPVVMTPGECWYLRLSDPHSVRNDGATPRVHLVIDAPAGDGLRALLATAADQVYRHAS